MFSLPEYWEWIESKPILMNKKPRLTPVFKKTHIPIEEISNFNKRRYEANRNKIFELTLVINEKTNFSFNL